jgi:hypothetical protein
MPGATLTQQTVGMVIRFAFAYLIATAAWLLTTGVVGYFFASGRAGLEAATLEVA